MAETIYKFICNDTGIAEAVELACPFSDKRRDQKPDESWLPKVTASYPDAATYFTKEGYDKYCQSGLRNWQYSVVEGQSKLILAERPNQVLYSDSYQVIADQKMVKTLREYTFHYEGPKPYIHPLEDKRPQLIGHHSSIRDWSALAVYTGSDESFTTFAPLGENLGLERIAFNHEILKPGKRSSWPHAHSQDEELIYVLKGTPDIWINGQLSFKWGSEH